MSSYAWSGAFALLCLLILLTQFIGVLVQEWLDRRALREAKRQQRLDAIIRMGFRAALMRGLIDEHGNVINRVGDWDDIR